MRNRHDAGLSLLEILLALFIAGSVLALVIPIFVGTSRSASIQTGVDMADLSAARVLKQLRSDLRAARLVELATSPDLPGIVYRLPATGEGIDLDGDIDWGPRRTLTFDVVGTIREADTGVDLNGDGDRADRFFRCRLQESVDGGSPRTVSASRFLLNADSPHGDLDGDGSPDPPFAQMTGGLRITLWSLIREDVSGLRRAQTDVTLRNPQGT